MRKFALSIAAVVMLAAPAAAHARDGGMLTAGEARSATRAWVDIQVQALEQFHGLSVSSARISRRAERVGPRAVVVPVTFALRWDDGANFVCLNRVYVTEQGRAVRAHPSQFDCD